MITLATLPNVTAKEVFDQISEHLLSQNVKSVRDTSINNMCGYRGENGTKCAAGCLISDDEYTEKMEGFRWSSLVQKGIVPETHRVLISDLQTIHDCRQPHMWKKELLRIKNRHNL